MEKNKFIPVSREVFIEELSKHNFLDKYKNRVDEAYFESDQNEFQIYMGDLENDKILKFDALNLIVVGNIKTKWLNAANNHDLGFDEGGTLFILGDIECDYFSNHFGKSVIIGGSLNADKILDNAFQDSDLAIQNNLKTEYFSGLDIWAEIGGSAEMKYGEGYCLPIGHTEPEEQAIEPKHSESESHEFLGIKDKIIDYRDSESLVREIIEQRNK